MRVSAFIAGLNWGVANWRVLAELTKSIFALSRLGMLMAIIAMPMYGMCSKTAEAVGKDDRHGNKKLYPIGALAHEFYYRAHSRT